MDSYEKLENRIRFIIDVFDKKGDLAWQRYKSREDGGNAYDEATSDVCDEIVGALQDALEGDK